MTKRNTADVHAAFVARKADQNARYELATRIAQLSAPQLAALHSYKARHGRTWKAKLLDMWQSGRDAFEPDEAILRTVRNQLGPSGLLKVRL